jgi:acetolactate synthase-1/2/3 large subunit
MKIKVSDYIVNFFSKNNIDTVFSITGGFSMHLSDSFEKSKKYNIYYQHHEQACGYSAVGYSKTNARPSIVCTTAGCAATNAITPCLVAYQDSIPILFITGQVKSTETLSFINNDKIKLRHYSGADCNIISCVKEITKYAKEILNVDSVNEILIEAYSNLINGRLGPVWLSIPIDIQGMMIDDTEIPIIEKDFNNNIISNEFEYIYDLLLKSNRPLIIAGNGIKLSKSCNKFHNFIDKYKIPVVISILGTDLIKTENELYSGKIGLIGDRHGNFTLQNCDLIISLGCRLAQGVVGYRSDWFAREAKIVYIDNDDEELKKENVNYTLKVKMDLNIFFDNFNWLNFRVNHDWINKCNHWKNKWMYELPPTCDSDLNGINPYLTLKHLYNLAPENKISVSSAGSIVTNVWHMIKIKTGDKFIHSSQGDMSFELPASIGCQIAEPNKMVICIVGEGTFQLNIQELQTIVHHKIPIKIILFNNGGYGANIITQSNFFQNKIGCDAESGISFPSTEKIAYAYGIKYLFVDKIVNLETKIQEFLDTPETVILEVISSIQVRYPRINSTKNEDGTFSNKPFEDMDPFLDREEFENEMIIKRVS